VKVVKLFLTELQALQYVEYMDGIGNLFINKRLDGRYEVIEMG
jgi:hypothetical protein